MTEEAGIEKKLNYFFCLSVHKDQGRMPRFGFFSCKEEGEIPKATEDQGYADNQDIRTNQNKTKPEDAVSAHRLPIDEKDYL